MNNDIPFVKQTYDMSELLKDPVFAKKIEIMRKQIKIDQLTASIAPLKQLLENSHILVEYSKKDKGYRQVLCATDYNTAQALIDRKIGFDIMGYDCKLKKRRGYFYAIEQIAAETKQQAQEQLNEINTRIDKLQKEIEQCE